MMTIRKESGSVGQHIEGEKKKRSTAMETPDFSSMNRDELLQWAKKSHLKTDIGDLKGVNIDYARDTVKVLSEFEHKMGGSTIPD